MPASNKIIKWEIQKSDENKNNYQAKILSDNDSRFERRFNANLLVKLPGLSHNSAFIKPQNTKNQSYQLMNRPDKPFKQ